MTISVPVVSRHRSPPAHTNVLGSTAAGLLVQRAWSCPGCGEPTQAVHPVDAEDSLVELVRRSARVLEAPGDSLRRRPVESGSWTVLDFIAHASETVMVAESAVLLLMAEPHRTVRAQIEAPLAAVNGSTTAAALGSLTFNASSLAGAIARMGVDAWYQTFCAGNTSIAELVWLTLHHATHLVEDAELTLDDVSARASA